MESWTVRDVRPLQIKTLFPNSVTDLGIVICFNLKQNIKTLLPILVIVSGIIIFSRLEKHSKA